MHLVNHKSPMPLLLTSLHSSWLCSQRNVLQLRSLPCEFSIFCQPLWASQSLRKLLAIIWLIHGNNRQNETSSTALHCFIRIDAFCVKDAVEWDATTDIWVWRTQDIAIGNATGFPSCYFFVSYFSFRSSFSVSLFWPLFFPLSFKAAI